MTATPAFDAAYDELVGFIKHAQLRAHLAEQIVAVLDAAQRRRGPGWLLQLAQSRQTRRDAVGRIWDGQPELGRAPIDAVDAACRSAARAMWAHAELNEGAS